MAKHKQKTGSRTRKAKNEVHKVKWLPLLLLAIIVIYTAAYCVIFVGGPSFYGDDTVYLNLAYNAIHNTFREGSFIFSVRLLQVFPIALSYELFGVSLLSSSAWDIFSFVGSVIIAFFVGRELYDDYAGVLAAALLSFFPLVVMLAPTISDNIPLMFITGLAVMSFIFATKRNSKAWYLMTGIFSVASLLVTPEGVVATYFVIFLLLIYLALKKIKVNRTSLYYIYGLILALLVLFAFNYVNSGNAFVTVTTNLHFYSAVGQQNTIPSTNTNLMFYPDVMFPLNGFSILSPNLQAFISFLYNPMNNYSGLYFFALVISAVYLFARFEKKAFIPILWFLFGFLYLELGPMHFSLFPLQYLLSYRLQRFLTIIAIPTVIVISIGATRFIKNMYKLRNRAVKFVSIAIILFLILLLVGTSIPINLYWYQGLAYERYGQLSIANYLSKLPSNTRIYISSAFSMLPIYMQFDNMSRFIIYDNIKNCRSMQTNSYVVLPKYINLFNLNYTPNPPSSCGIWSLVLYPKMNGNFSPAIKTMAYPFDAKLYYIYYNGTNSTRDSSQTNSTKTVNQTASATNSTLSNQTLQTSNTQYNYFNLTGVGVRSNNSISNFSVVNNVSNVSVELSKFSASPGEPVIVNVTFAGSFKWSANNATSYYLHSKVINVHYYGIELANQTGKLLDQADGPWWDFVTQNGTPQQILYGNPNTYLRIQWNITPNSTLVGNRLKICGGYFAAYENTTQHGGWGNLFDILSSNQTRIVNSTVINIPSSNCAYLNVT